MDKRRKKRGDIEAGFEKDLQKLDAEVRGRMEEAERAALVTSLSLYTYAGTRDG